MNPLTIQDLKNYRQTLEFQMQAIDTLINFMETQEKFKEAFPFMEQFLMNPMASTPFQAMWTQYQQFLESTMKQAGEKK